MSTRTSIKTSLPHWSLPLLAVILSGGACFYLTFYRQHPTSTIAVLFFISLLLIIVFLQYKQGQKNRTTMEQLTRHMHKVDADSPADSFAVKANTLTEGHELALSYNAMIDRLSHSLKRSRQFAADVTHELRTPLTILRGETELALRGNRDHKQMIQILESNLEEISRMSYLIEDLLLLSKSDLGEIPLKKEAIDLTGLVLELHHQAQLLAASKQINVALVVPEQQVIVQADNLRLRQVLLNLLANAIKYNDNEGNVTINLTATATEAEIAIKDDGIGISDEHLMKIFERFYRIGKTLNRNDGGSGLGLAIVKWIVDAHDGQIRVSSAPGRGSCFTIILPLEKKTAA